MMGPRRYLIFKLWLLVEWPMIVLQGQGQSLSTIISSEGAHSCMITWLKKQYFSLSFPACYYRDADKSLVRLGRKQDNVSVRMAWISSCALPCRKRNLMTDRVSILLNRARPWHASELVSCLVGLRTYQHPGKIWIFPCVNYTCQKINYIMFMPDVSRRR